ncbi:unnamed protein product [Fusarium graminearum]|uniref:Methyltransferase type 11 domain-containing protein n=1 Tax=Gibberella zeae TaxID=5518 RepID=A0A9N8RC04_GIBZA|nr:unnamed protein product [Fusarium graminearum]
MATTIQEPIEPITADQHSEDENEFQTSDFDSSTLSSSSTSLNTSIYQHAFENGRRQNRDDMKHAMMLELTNGNLYFSPIADNPQKIIDLATGTGIWAIDIADKFPSASVVGVDLSPIQPSWVPPNLKFLVDDIEDEWMHGDDYDFVHMRCISPWLKDEVKVLHQAHDHMKPGAWIEIQELDARANCDDGSLPKDAPLAKFFDTAATAVASFGMKFRAGENLREPLEKAGFVNVSCKVLKVPIGTWAKDKKLRLIGLYLKTAVSDMFGAMAAKPLRKVMGPDEIELFLIDARKDLNNTMSDQPATVAAPAARSDLASAVESAPAPQPELVPAADPQTGADSRWEDGDESEADSAVGDDAASSTASITSSILEYRTIQGRTFHSDRHPTEYFTPNDEQQSASIDINHQALTLLLGGKLFLAPVKPNVQRVLDVGTGTDEYPEAEVIGSDLSPIQPTWVPPNVKFEIDDASLRWTWDNNTFDFIHIRYLFGAIKDWTSLFQEAYRCCAADGWIQSGEADVHIRSDDGTTDDIDCLKLWAKLFTEGGKLLGNSFFVQDGDLQEKGIHEAGFTDIKSIEYKARFALNFPIGGWPKDPELREVGNFVRATLENDLEGYTLLLWKTILQWPDDEYQVFLMEMRKFLRNRKVHPYMTVRYVYGRKAGES